MNTQKKDGGMNESNKESTTYVEVDYQSILEKYKNDPVYGQCYPGLVSVLGMIRRNNQQTISFESYVAIFQEAEELVNNTLNSKFPEIEINNSQTFLINKYVNKQYGNTTAITADRLIGCLIEMVYIIALWDKMEEKSDLVKQAFSDCRMYVEHHDYPRLYTSNNMWHLIAARIEYEETPRKEDLEQIIIKLKARLGEGVDNSQITSDNKKDEIIKQLQEEKRQLIEELEDYKKEPIAKKPSDKVRLEIMSRFLTESGVDLEKFGNKAEAARFAEYVTGIKFQICKNYMSSQNLNTSTHADEVNEVNRRLRKLGSNWLL